MTNLKYFYRSSMLPAVFLLLSACDESQDNQQKLQPANEKSEHSGHNLHPESSVLTNQHSKLPAGYSLVELNPERIQRFGIRSEIVSSAALTREVRTVGIVSPNETRESHVHVKWNGWIEEVFVNYVGQKVNLGDPLFSVYSPELVAAQQELLIALRRVNDAKDKAKTTELQAAQNLLDTSRAKLRLWNFPADAMVELEKQGKLRQLVTIRAPLSGTVISKSALSGIFVEPAMELYTITDLSNIWIIADLYEFEIPYIALGQVASFSPIASLDPNQTIEAQVIFISPMVDPKTRSVKVRLEIVNSGTNKPSIPVLRPGAFGTVRFKQNLAKTLVIGINAIIYTGERQLVFVKLEDGVFQPREVLLGVRNKNWVQVLKGLREGEEVVMRGQFLLDSESRLRLEGMDAGHAAGHN